MCVCVFVNFPGSVSPSLQMMDSGGLRCLLLVLTVATSLRHVSAQTYNVVPNRDGQCSGTPVQGDTQGPTKGSGPGGPSGDLDPERDPDVQLCPSFVKLTLPRIHESRIGSEMSLTLPVTGGGCAQNKISHKKTFSNVTSLGHCIGARGHVSVSGCVGGESMGLVTSTSTVLADQANLAARSNAGTGFNFADSIAVTPALTNVELGQCLTICQTLRECSAIEFTAQTNCGTTTTERGTCVYTEQTGSPLSTTTLQVTSRGTSARASCSGGVSGTSVYVKYCEYCERVGE